MTLMVRHAGQADEAAWEAFVFEHPAATFFHRFAWSRVLQRAFGHTPYFLMAEEQGALVGVLPLAEVKSRLFGNSLSSLPFCVYGGLLAASPKAEEALRSAACDLAQSLGVGALELRNREDSNSDWPTKNLYYTFRKTLAPEQATNLKAIPNRQRAMLRKALGEGLYTEETTNTQRIYRVYSESVRNLGTPIFHRRYFDILLEEFGKDCRIMMVCQSTAPDALYQQKDDAQLQRGPAPEAVGDASQGAEDVAGVLSFYFRGEVLPYYGGSISRARDIRGANHFIYWELMRRSVDEGLTGFDFGRSKEGSGPFAFKKNFGFEPAPLAYEYHLVKADNIPDKNPNNPRYRLLVQAWQRLPLPVANLVGPPLARSLG